MRIASIDIIQSTSNLQLLAPHHRASPTRFASGRGGREIMTRRTTTQEAVAAEALRRRAPHEKIKQASNQILVCCWEGKSIKE